jgi:hypothetical protein
LNSVDCISAFESRGELLSLKSVANPVEGDLKTRREAKSEFKRFIIKAYNELYKIESKVLMATSSICVFCRLDIGLITKDGQVNYFVNEVERTQTASLWSNSAKAGNKRSKIELFGSTFSESFYKWLSSTIQPHAS